MQIETSKYEFLKQLAVCYMAQGEDGSFVPPRMYGCDATEAASLLGITYEELKEQFLNGSLDREKLIKLLIAKGRE